MEKIKNYIIYGLVVLILMVFAYYDIHMAKLEKQNLDLRNEVAKLDTVKMNKDSSYSKLIFEFNKEKDLVSFLKRENSRMANELNNPSVVIISNTVPESVKVNSFNMTSGDTLIQEVDTTKTLKELK